MSVFRITPTTQKYDWGKIGLDSKVAQFATTSSLPHFTLDKSATYAEVRQLVHTPLELISFSFSAAMDGHTPVFAFLDHFRPNKASL